jgi:hypothetical protein
MIIKGIRCPSLFAPLLLVFWDFQLRFAQLELQSQLNSNLVKNCFPIGKNRYTKKL